MRLEFSQSPFFLIESSLERLLESRLDINDFLELVEAQHERVCGWLDRLQDHPSADFETGVRMQELGLEGSSVMLEALEHIHTAACEGDEETLEHASELLFDGHSLVEESFHLCAKIEAEADDEIAASICLVKA